MISLAGNRLSFLSTKLCTCRFSSTMANDIKSRGALIVLEGCDRTGKSTQCKKLMESLASLNMPAAALRFPDRTTQIGSMISRYLSNDVELDDHTVHLLFSANRWELVSNMKKLLSEGVSLIIDRYAFSGVAFSTAKGLSLDWCKSPDVGLPRPDLVLLLEMPLEAALKRQEFGTERYEVPEMQLKVSELYGQLKDDTYWKVVDASQSIESVHEDIFSKVKVAIKSVTSSNPPILPLWAKLENGISENGHGESQKQ